MNPSDFGPLPQSDRNDNLQEESLRAFTALFPPSDFRVRSEPGKDAGVDRYLEVKLSGCDTNLRSQIQLKGVARSRPNLDGSHSKSIETSNLNYLLNGPCPMYVLYVAESRISYFSWARDLAAELRRSHPQWRKAQTVAIRFSRVLDQSVLEEIRDRIIRDEQFSRHIHEHLRFSVSSGGDAFEQIGKAMVIESSEMEAISASAHTEVLQHHTKQQGDIQVKRKKAGMLQTYFTYSNEVTTIQFEGYWDVRSSGMTFTGFLLDSPLKISAELLSTEPGRFKPCAAVTFSFSWDEWHGKPLRKLPFFNEILKFLQANDYELNFYIEGSHMWRLHYTSPDIEIRSQARQSMDWIGECIQLAKKLGVHPKLPSIAQVNSNFADDVKLMLELQDLGFHEQSHEAQSCVIEASKPAEGPLPERNVQAKLIKQRIGWRAMSFFGTPTPFGPLQYSFSNVRLEGLRSVSESRFEMIWVGEKESRYRIEWDRSQLANSSKNNRIGSSE